MMTHVTEEGTAAGLTVQGASFAGKTGTAEIDVEAGHQPALVHRLRPRRRPADRGRGDARDLHGCFGGEVAGPIATQVMDDLLGWAEFVSSSPDSVIGGRYRLISRLGAGGMADVWLADDEMLDRKVALKFLHERFAQDAQFVERFRREAQAAAGLQHPNIVGVFDRGETEGRHWIAMEYVEGASLADLIARGLSVGEAVEIVRQILVGARFAHARGIIHRDLKPQNVLVDAEGRARVADFGIARAGVSEITATGSVLGTAQYLSPEQAQGLEVTAAADLYSVGVILYEALTGQGPVRGRLAGGRGAQAGLRAAAPAERGQPAGCRRRSTGSSCARSPRTPQNRYAVGRRVPARARGRRGRSRRGLGQTAACARGRRRRRGAERARARERQPAGGGGWTPRRKIALR